MAETHGKPLSARRNISVERRKLYEEMLLKEISARTNEPMHAVLEAELGESGMTDGCEGQIIRNHALIHYLATLANSNNTNDTFDFDFVDSLLKNGADVNSTDKTGQTIFHEVARSWNTDVATFLFKNGAQVNQKDNYGRSPLHVAAAVDYADMVEFLLQNGADINIRTNEEQQTPIHFAAKNDAINSLQMLLAYGADIDSRDGKNRTPLQISSQMNRSKAAKHLINEGAPAGVYDNVGNSALSLLIERIPEVALEALDQFHSSDSINRKHYYFLNYLEGTKLKEKKTPARTPLEIAVQNERYEIILHPVMQRLIGVKWNMYGKWGAILDLVLNLFYTILCTVLGVSLPKTGREMYEPLAQNSWRLVIGILLIMLTIYEIKMQTMNTVKTRQEFTTWRDWRANELEGDFKYCHPRWPQETEYLRSEIKGVRNMSFIRGTDWWIYFDWVALALILATIASHVTFFHFNNNISKQVHQYITIVLLLILWLRMFKYARPFEGAGPFVVIFGSVVGDILKWAFLNLVIVIPYTSAFWIIFGPYSLNPVASYSNVSPLLYNMFSMMVVDNHDYEELEEAHPTMARLLSGTFIIISAIVTLNLLIALLSNTFERHYENAVANAAMQRARTILLLQKSLRRKQKKRYYDFIRNNGSPEVIWNDVGRFTGTDIEERATIERLREDVQIIISILGERLGKRFGKKGKKSDMEFVKMDVCKLRVCQEELVADTRNMKITLNGLKETAEFLKNNININNNDANNNNNSNGNNNGNSNDVNSNDVNNTEKTPIARTNRPVSSTVVNPTLGKKAALGKDSEINDSSTTHDTSESSSDTDTKKSRRKRSSKSQDKHRRKNKKHDHHGGDEDEKNPKRGTEELSDYPAALYAGTRNDVGHHGDWQPTWQEFWRNSGVPQNESSHAYPPQRTNQSLSSFSPLQHRQGDQGGAENPRRYQAHRDSQPRFTEFNSNMFQFPSPRRVTDVNYRYNQQLTEQRDYLNGQRRSFEIATPRPFDTMAYPRPVSNIVQEQNNLRHETGQYFQQPDGVQNYGQERFIQGQNGFTNYMYGRVGREASGPTSQPDGNIQPYLYINKPVLQPYPSPSVYTDLTGTSQQSSWSRGRMQDRGPNYPGMDTQSNPYHGNGVVSQNIHLSMPPKQAPPTRDVINTTTQNSERIPPMASQIQRSPSKYEFQVVNPSEPSADMPTQSQLPVIDEQDHTSRFSSSVLNRQGKINETEVGEQRVAAGLFREYSQSNSMPDLTKIRNTPVVRVQPESDSSSEPPDIPSSVQNQFIKNKLQTEPEPIIRYSPSIPMSPEIMEKVEFFERKSGEADIRTSPEPEVLSQANEYREFQIGLSGHDLQNPTVSPTYPVASPEHPVIFPKNPSVSSKVPAISPQLTYDPLRFPMPVPSEMTQDEINKEVIGEGETGRSLCVASNSETSSDSDVNSEVEEQDSSKIADS